MKLYQGSNSYQAALRRSLCGYYNFNFRIVYDRITQRGRVAPFAGAWIEISERFKTLMDERVAPFAGAWIEISCKLVTSVSNAVAPFAGARIEKNNELLRNHKQRVEVPFL